MEIIKKSLSLKYKILSVDVLSFTFKWYIELKTVLILSRNFNYIQADVTLKLINVSSKRGERLIIVEKNPDNISFHMKLNKLTIMNLQVK